jgi:16S rRNA (guanine527-N7)-methyltransferase
LQRTRLTIVSSPIDRAAAFAEIRLDAVARAGLDRLGKWLQDEALPAGAIGPAEADRIESRHLADSLVMGHGWATGRPGLVADLGSGAGLPGLPLAIALPDWRFELVERSAGRCRLLGRARRVLELDNVTVVEGDFGRGGGPVDVVVTRAAMPPGQLDRVVRGWIAGPGMAVAAVSPTAEPPPGAEAVDIPPHILDRRARILIMRMQ